MPTPPDMVSAAERMDLWQPTPIALTSNPGLDVKRAAAIAWMERRWLLHPLNSPRKRRPGRQEP